MARARRGYAATSFVLEFQESCPCRTVTYEFDERGLYGGVRVLIPLDYSLISAFAETAGFFGSYHGRTHKVGVSVGMMDVDIWPVRPFFRAGYRFPRGRLATDLPAVMAGPHRAVDAAVPMWGVGADFGRRYGLVLRFDVATDITTDDDLNCSVHAQTFARVETPGGGRHDRLRWAFEDAAVADGARGVVVRGWRRRCGARP